MRIAKYSPDTGNLTVQDAGENVLETLWIYNEKAMPPSASAFDRALEAAGERRIGPWNCTAFGGFSADLESR